MTDPIKTFEELSIPDRRALQGKDGRPNMRRVRECLLGMHESDYRSRTSAFAMEIAQTHATQMHDYIVELESRVAENCDAAKQEVRVQEREGVPPWVCGPGERLPPAPPFKELPPDPPPKPVKPEAKPQPEPKPEKEAERDDQDAGDSDAAAKTD